MRTGWRPSTVAAKHLQAADLRQLVKFFLLLSLAMSFNLA
jgi:hypothetical protein